MVPEPQEPRAFPAPGAAAGDSARRVPARPAPEPATAPSLIETMRVEPGGLVPLLEGHLQRLHRSCAALGHSWPGEAAVRDRVAQTIAGLHDGQTWRLRLLLAPDGGLSLETGLLAPPRTPLKVALRGPRAAGAENWLRHKTTHRPWYEHAAQWLADHPDVFDVLYWNENGEMCEGSRSNLYMRTPGGGWLTPPLGSGALPGVQRQALLDAGLVEVGPIHRDDFLRAPAWRISNALRGWRDAVLVDA